MMLRFSKKRFLRKIDKIARNWRDCEVLDNLRIWLLKLLTQRDCNTFQDNVLITRKGRFILENKILKIVSLKRRILWIFYLNTSKIVVLFDYHNFDKDHPVSNLCLFNEGGKKLWDACLPIESSRNRYKFESYEDLYNPIGNTYLKENEIAASSTESYCILDTLTGTMKEMHVNR